MNGNAIVPVVTTPVVPARIRQLITVEGCLNDRIATPVVMLSIAGAPSRDGSRPDSSCALV